MKHAIVLALTTCALALPAAAHDADFDDVSRDDRSGRADRPVRYTPGHDPRQVFIVTMSADLIARTESDVRRGMRDGLITPREADRLRGELRDYDALRQRVLRDGYVSRGEEKQLARAEFRLRERMEREMFDEDRRDAHRHGWDRRGDDRDHHHDDVRPVVAVGPHHHSGC